MRRRIFAFWIRVAGCKEKIVQSSSVLTDWISCWVRKVWHHNHATHNSRKKPVHQIFYFYLSSSSWIIVLHLQPLFVLFMRTWKKNSSFSKAFSYTTFKSTHFFAIATKKAFAKQPNSQMMVILTQKAAKSGQLIKM